MGMAAMQNTESPTDPAKCTIFHTKGQQPKLEFWRIWPDTQQNPFTDKNEATGSGGTLQDLQGNYAKSLIDQFKNGGWVEGQCAPQEGISIMATAGMRLLSKEENKNVWDAICNKR